jgi:hypothetical protein
MLNIEGKYLYTGEKESIMDGDSETIILRRGDRVTIKLFVPDTTHAYVCTETSTIAWIVGIRFLTPLEDFPEDYFPDTFYWQNRNLLMELHE